MAPTDILSALQEPLYTGGDTYSGIGARAVAQSLPSLVNPYASTGSNALNVFGGSILAALLGNMAKSDAAEENAKIVTQQSNYLSAAPEQRLVMAQQNPKLFSRLQTALGANDLVQQSQDTSLIRQLKIKNALENQANLEDPEQLKIKFDAFGIPESARSAIRTKDDFNNYLKYDPADQLTRRDLQQRQLDEVKSRADLARAERQAKLEIPGYEFKGTVRPSESEASKVREDLGNNAKLRESLAMIGDNIDKQGFTDIFGNNAALQGALYSTVYSATRKDIGTGAGLTGNEAKLIEIMVPRVAAGDFSGAIAAALKDQNPAQLARDLIKINEKLERASLKARYQAEPLGSMGMELPSTSDADKATFAAQFKAANPNSTAEQARAAWAAQGGR